MVVQGPRSALAPKRNAHFPKSDAGGWEKKKPGYRVFLALPTYRCNCGYCSLVGKYV